MWLQLEGVSSVQVVELTAPWGAAVTGRGEAAVPVGCPPVLPPAPRASKCPLSASKCSFRDNKWDPLAEMGLRTSWEGTGDPHPCSHGQKLLGGCKTAPKRILKPHSSFYTRLWTHRGWGGGEGHMDRDTDSKNRGIEIKT